MNNITKIDFSIETFKNLLMKDFVDMRISNESIILEFHYWDEIYQFNDWTFSFEHLDQILKKFISLSNFNNNIDWQKYFSIHIPITWNDKEIKYYQWYRWVRKESIKGVELTIRKLTTPRNIYDFIYDEKLIEVIIKSLLSRKWFIISGQTWSWKSTILISLLNYFNNVDYNSFIINHIKTLLVKELNNIKSNTYLEVIKHYTTEQINKFLNDIGILFDKIIVDFDNQNNNILTTKEYINFVWNNKNLNQDKIVWNIVLNFLKNSKNLYSELEEYSSSNLINLMKQFALSRLRNIVTLEEPIEYIYTNNKLRFFQHSLSLHFKNNYIEFINQILRDNPNICYIAEVRNPEEIDTFLTSMSIGITSMTTAHAYDSLETLLKILDLSNKNPNEVMNILTNSFRSWINIQSYYFSCLKDYKKNINWYIQWWDYLDFSVSWLPIMFKNYFMKNDLLNMVEILNDWHEFTSGHLWYYPKKITLVYRLMLLYNDIIKSWIINQWFKMESFIDEVKVLLQQNSAIVWEKDLRYFRYIYWTSVIEDITKFLSVIN